MYSALRTPNVQFMRPPHAQGRRASKHACLPEIITSMVHEFQFEAAAHVSSLTALECRLSSRYDLGEAPLLGAQETHAMDVPDTAACLASPMDPQDIKAARSLRVKSDDSSRCITAQRQRQRHRIALRGARWASMLRRIRRRWRLQRECGQFGRRG